MSAWYVLSSLGFYAVDPVSANYVFGGPLFERATIQLGNGKKLGIESPGNSPEKQYIQSITWNGQPYTKCWFSHEQIAQGGTFAITMGTKPNEQFAFDLLDRPPSFT